MRFDFANNVDASFQNIALLLVIVILISYSTLFEEHYSQKLTYLYIHPWWRFLVLFLLIAAALWSPRLGIMSALLIFFYLSDMNTLITPLPNL